jgi:hypothetical protein
LASGNRKKPHLILFIILNEVNIMQYTKSTAFVIVDITDPQFCPGKRIPSGFDLQGPWLFFPWHWIEKDHDYGSFVGLLTGHPMLYSPGFETEEEALQKAEEWEIKCRETQDHWWLKGKTHYDNS